MGSSTTTSHAVGESPSRANTLEGEAANGEEGAVAVIIALLLVVFVGVSALAIDLGSAWASQRQLVADLDAASLAGVETLDEIGKSGCAADDQPVVDEVVSMSAANGVTVEEADIAVDCAAGTVTVAGQRDATSVFAPAMGLDELLAGTRSGATIDPDYGGVMPIAICINEGLIDEFINTPIAGGNPNSAPWLALQTNGGWSALDPADQPMYPRTDLAGEDYYGPPHRPEFVVGRTGFERVWQSGACGDAGPGNWEWIDWSPGPGGGGGSNELRDAIVNGDGHVDLDASPKECGTLSNGKCGVETGSMGGGGSSPIEVLRDTWACAANDDQCDTVAFVVYDTVTGTGSGTRYDLVGLLVGKLWDVSFSDEQFHIEPYAFITSGLPEELEILPTTARVCATPKADNCN